jgi:lambda repressor-like predicted transcriptional regulator
MRKQKTTRKARFEAALKLAGLTMQAFAAANDVSPAHLHYVLKGERTSERLTGLVDAFTEKYLSAITAA